MVLGAEMSNFNPSCIKIIVLVCVAQFFIYTGVLFWYFMMTSNCNCKNKDRVPVEVEQEDELKSDNEQE